MKTLTVNIDPLIKRKVQKCVEHDGITLTFLVNQSLKAYIDGKIKFGLIGSDDDITASFDVSTKDGKEACLKSFKTLVK